MRWLLDLAYLLVALLTSPVWLVRMIQTGKIRTDWPARLGRTASLGEPADRRRILLHAVSVGEVNAIRSLVRELADARSRPDIVIATTTDTGFARASALWSGQHRVVRYPLDLSWSVRRFLHAIRPDAVALVELEVWPNFTAECARRGIPICVISGRLTERSFRRYRRIAWLVRPSFGRLARVAAQEEAYSDRFRALGVPASAVTVSGTMKWDAAEIADEVPGAAELVEAMGLDRERPLVVAGSTAPGEHELIAAATPPGVQLLCAPRKPEWFDQAAAALPGCVRRSQPASRRDGADRFLLDTIGELRQAYALADIVVIGRSFGDLHGSDMIEPIALGKPTIVGPAFSDFRQTMEALLAGGGVVQATVHDLRTRIEQLLSDADLRSGLAAKGRAVIRAHQGVSRATAELIMELAANRVRRQKKNPPFRRLAGTAVEEKEERLGSRGA